MVRLLESNLLLLIKLDFVYKHRKNNEET